jgi:proteasome maturation protein
MPKSPQEPSYRLTPADTPKSASVQDTAGSLGLHDTLKHGPRSLATEAASSSSSAVHARLQNVCASSDSSRTMLTAVGSLSGKRRRTT